jgi:hypothetical protein
LPIILDLCFEIVAASRCPRRVQHFSDPGWSSPTSVTCKCRASRPRARGIVARKNCFAHDAAVELARTSRLACAAALAFAASAAVNERAARGTEAETQLDYDAAPGCPPADAFEAVVAGRLGYSPFRANARERVIVRIEPAGRALEGLLEWRDATGGWIGEQTFPSRTGHCGELARAMGFALALRIQLMATSALSAAPPEAAAPPDASTPAPTATPPSPAAGVSIAPPTATSQGNLTKSSLETPGPSILAGAGAAVGVGVSSSAVPFGRLFGTVAWSHVSVELAAEISVPSTTHRADGAGFTQQRFLASVAGCGVRRSLSACLVGKIGDIRVVGEGIDFPATSHGVVAQAGLRLAVTHMLGSHLQVGAHADSLALLTKGIVTLDGMPVWTTPRLAALFGADIGIRFR